MNSHSHEPHAYLRVSRHNHALRACANAHLSVLDTVAFIRRRSTMFNRIQRHLGSTHFLFVFTLVATCGLLFSGCNTTQGAGKDLENVGEGIQNSAERNK